MDERRRSMAATPATPQRQLPGSYFNTPGPPPRSIFDQYNQQPTRAQQQPQHQQQSQPSSQVGAPLISNIERAAAQINATLRTEASYPELDVYITQGVSGDYELPTSPAWNPYQPLKWHDFPARILEQANLGSVTTKMGFFAPLRHAWAAVDNCLYLWDYTVPNPELIGFEEQRNTIESVALVKPRKGVFVADISHLLVVATTAEMLLLGVAVQKTETGAKTIALYNTQMSIPTRGLGVRHIEGSARSGRIFFAGSFSEDLYEFRYQQQEGWFSGKTQRVCHTKSGLRLVEAASVRSLTGYIGQHQKPATFVQMVVDDTREQLYTLNDRNEIKVWSLKENVSLALTRTFQALMTKVNHFVPQTDLLSARSTTLVSLSPVPATEGRAVSLIATTNTGCRLYLSVLAVGGSETTAQRPPTSMEVKHIRFPPPETDAASRQPSNSSSEVARYGQPSGAGMVDTQSRYLYRTDMAYRFPPGYFFAFVQDSQGGEKMFCTAPDTARMYYDGSSPTHPSMRLSEFGQQISLNGPMTSVQLISEDLPATSTPLGFGNELAVQYDSPGAEIGILTSNGIQTIRRRRLVDIFASLMRYASQDSEGLQGDIKRFIRLYGRSETAATALAVACSKGVDVSGESRVASVSEPHILEKARSVFIDQGGKPEYNANANVDGGIDSVRPSARYDGLALYISRLVRSIWRAPLMSEQLDPTTGLKLVSSIPKPTLTRIQGDLEQLGKFLESNKGVIDGLSGPQSRLGSRQEEIALQGEHRAMTSLVALISSITEGISFVNVLFEERLEDVLALLSEDTKQKVKQLTYETLFTSAVGRELAKELVKAIVNRNIATGSSIETVAEALKRRCGNFCSADDVTIFKAQELVKRAGQAGPRTESGRLLLNESLTHFKHVASILTIGGDDSEGHLKWAVLHYSDMKFYAGALQLCLNVADAQDSSRLALGYLRDEKPENDPRKAAFDLRQRCYHFVFAIIEHVDNTTSAAEQSPAGLSNLDAKLRDEAYEVIASNEDFVFQTSLYDWYLETARQDRLLEIPSPSVPKYLALKAAALDLPAANLLWRYYIHNNDYLEAAAVQLQLAQGLFPLSLEQRVEYLSRARTNASTRPSLLFESRQSKQSLLRQIDDLLEVANIQDDLLQRFKADPRLSAERRPIILDALQNHGILSIDELFNKYADQASYHDLCLQIYQVADHRNPADIRASWAAYIAAETATATAAQEVQPWDHVANAVQELGLKLGVSDSTFPLRDLLPLLLRHAILDPSMAGSPETWALDIFLPPSPLSIAPEALLPVLEQLYYSNEYPFVGAERRGLAGGIVHVIESWMEESLRRGDRMPFGGEGEMEGAIDLLRRLLGSRDGLGRESRGRAEEVLGRVARLAGR
ncbi:hypothetical protein B0A48_09127 [Cryoendolithus antarcticus]|uniref:Nucleoporin n=1 Tax=Cryoendolithus antarcticus TaxID=1507870 RepID=A0A1V8T219_9PEZI|nr:hypothetical protein B0A48_09127 [Cryoendolithus antarcticus]